MKQFNLKKNTHIVFKVADVLKSLTPDEQNQLAKLSEKIARYRENDHRNPCPDYYVVNTDEPYANAVLEVIKLGESL